MAAVFKQTNSYTMLQLIENNFLQWLLSALGVGIMFYVKAGYQEIKAMRKELQEMRLFYVSHDKDIDFLKQSIQEQKEKFERLEQNHNTLARHLYKN
jgi:hypothetical protein